MTTCSYRSASLSRIGLAAILLACALSTAGWTAGETGRVVYVVVVSPDVEVRDVSTEQLRRLFMFREKYWMIGKPVHLILPENQLSPKSVLLTQVYRMDYDALRRLILENLYQGNIDLAPRVVVSDSVAVEYVEAGRGLISFVRFDATAGRQVRVLNIDGVAPGSPSYSLQR